MLPTLEDLIAALDFDYAINNVSFNSKSMKSSIIDHVHSFPVIDGQAGLLPTLLVCANQNYSEIIDSRDFRFSDRQTKSQQVRAYTESQLEKMPWYLSHLSKVFKCDLEIANFLFSSLNDAYSGSNTPAILSDCLFKTCKFSSTSSKTLLRRVTEALTIGFRWFCLDLDYMALEGKDTWTVQGARGDSEEPIENLINTLVNSGFVSTSMPLILRLCIKDSDTVIEKLQDLSEMLLSTFGSQVIVTPSFIQNTEVEKLRFKVRFVSTSQDIDLLWTP
jgi:hypothetical protein